jgi:hypothetical protein
MDLPRRSDETAGGSTRSLYLLGGVTALLIVLTVAGRAIPLDARDSVRTILQIVGALFALASIGWALTAVAASPVRTAILLILVAALLGFVVDRSANGPLVVVSQLLQGVVIVAALVVMWRRPRV